MTELIFLAYAFVGFIWGHLVDRLIKEGYEVVVLDDFFTGKIENVKCHLDSEKFYLTKGDVRNSEDVKEAISARMPEGD